jgi:hypothetical protein
VTLPEARRRVWTFRLLGGGLVVCAFASLILILVKHAYETMPSDLLFQPLGRSLRHAISPTLETSPVMALTWSLVPSGNLQYLYLVLMGSMIWIAIGVAIVKYANRLSGRIRRARETIEEERWRRSLGDVDLSRDMGVLSAPTGVRGALVSKTGRARVDRSDYHDYWRAGRGFRRILALSLRETSEESSCGPIPSTVFLFRG